MRDIIVNDLKEARLMIDAFLDKEENLILVEEAADLMVACIRQGGRIFSCGNGGSMSDAMHFASELTGRYKKDRIALPAIAISDPGHLSCVANDFGYEDVFARYLYGNATNRDIVLLLSTSGNSQNMLKALDAARDLDMRCVSICGNHGGAMRQDMVDLGFQFERQSKFILIPHNVGLPTDRIQEMTIKIIHILVKLIEKKMEL